LSFLVFLTNKSHTFILINTSNKRSKASQKTQPRESHVRGAIFLPAYLRRDRIIGCYFIFSVDLPTAGRKEGKPARITRTNHP
jgi:hypothetical protein